MNTQIEIVRGVPTDAELAALVVVLTRAARRPAAATQPPRAEGDWHDPRASLRTAPLVGPGAWVAAARVAGSRTRAAW
ncbi:MAG: acyl-CoA carboxylase subunit epsilon [Mycobacteriales bacterium]